MATTAVLGAMALVVLDAGITNIALPTIARSLDVSPAASILVASAYQLALLMGLLPAAHLAERFGQRRIFVSGVAIFTAASALAAFARNFDMLVAARFMQGLGGAAILALGIALLRFTLGSDRLGSAIAWNALNVALCAAAGPTIGALVLTYTDWPWLFLVNLPLGVVVMAASRALPKIASGEGKIDAVSIVLYATGAGLLFLAFELVAIDALTAAGLGVLAIIAFAVIVRREAPKAMPLVPFDLLSHRPFRLAVAASVCCFVAQSAGLIALPFYLQLELSTSTLATGILLACWPIAVALTSPWVSRLALRHDAGLLCGAGATILCAGLASAALLPIHTSVVPLGLCAMACGIGFGFFQVPNNRNLFLAASPERSSAAGGMQGTARLIGQTAGGVLVTLMFTSPLGMPKSQLALAVAALFALAAAFVSLSRVAPGNRPPLPSGI